MQAPPSTAPEPRAWSATLVAALACALLPACNVERFAVGKLGNALAEGGETWMQDDDPELIRSAAPFSLKLVESLLSKDPEHDGLLLAAASGFTQYAWGFVQQDAERMEAVDLARSRELAERARKLYHRAREYGLRGLDARHPGFRETLLEDPATAIVDAERADVPFLYWTAAAWGLELSLSKTDPMALADLPAVQALIDRALELDEGWNGGAIHGFLILFEETRPGGGRDWTERSKQHYERAVELSKGRRAAPHVAFAEAVPMKKQDKAGFVQLLDAALAIDSTQYPEVRLENELAQARARWLASRVDELFVE
ncbi:MAG: TRAP transporter TatT component family protein [Planctomycetes bacterium]|nr:TRAP transporter TatT component family protein [Planctomycetota bacterium]